MLDSIRAYPRLLLLGLAVSLVVTVAVVGGTSTDAFGAYNSAWDGTSELRQTGSEAGTEPTLARNISAYQTSEPNQSVALVLSPAEPYSPDEASVVSSFVRAGGTVVVAEDYRPHSNTLLSAIGAEARVTGVPLRDEQRSGPGPAFPKASTTGDHPVTAGVDQLVLNHGSTIRPGNATPLATASEFSYLDRNRNGQLDDTETLREHPVMTVESVGNGTVIVVSDPSFFLNAMLERSDNRAFARNIMQSQATVLLDISHTSALPPLVALQLTLQESTMISFAVGTLSVLLVILLTRPGVVDAVRQLRERPSPSPTLSQAEIMATLRKRHPEWDEQRIERVTDVLTERTSSGKQNE